MMRLKSLFLIAAAGLLLWGADGLAAEPLSSWRKSVARKCRSKADSHRMKKLFLTARTVTDLGLSFYPADSGLQKLNDALRFVPRIPLSTVHGGLRPGNLPTAAEMAQKGHKVNEDSEALIAFWKTGRDKMLLSFLKSLMSVGRKKANRELAGTFASIIRNLSKQTPAWGEWTAFKLAEDFMMKLGFKVDNRTGKPISPSEIAFHELRNKLALEKLKALPQEIAVEEISPRSDFEDNLDIVLQKYRSDHFRIEAPFAKGQADGKLALALLEEHYRLFVEKMRHKDPGRLSDPMTVVILPGKAEFDVYIDMMTTESAERRKFLKSSTGAHPVPVKGLFVVYDHLLSQGTPFAAPAMLPLRDKMGTLAVETVAFRFGYRYFPQWVRYGLGSFFTLAVLGTAETGRISMQETTGIEQTEWYNYTRWHELLRTAVDRGMDPGTGSLLARENANEINWTHRAKMYSLADYYIQKDVEALKSFLRNVAADWKSWKRAGDGEFPPLKSAGYPVKRLDREWRAYVKAKY